MSTPELSKKAILSHCKHLDIESGNLIKLILDLNLSDKTDDDYINLVKKNFAETQKDYRDYIFCLRELRFKTRLK
tara:strand:+ start:2816 stop:3040 length:225 start_codon:yes stop_codon:yes gene_type:complete